MSLERKVVFRPAFDRRHTDPKQNYGVNGVEIVFSVTGPEGGVTYTIMTHWMLPHVTAEMSAAGNSLFAKPTSAGLDGHWKVPQYEGQPPIIDCPITGGDCYCDGTSITKDLFAQFLAEGDSAIWTKLEECYENWRPK